MLVFLGSLEPIKDHRFQVREMAKRDLFYILHHNHPLASKKSITIFRRHR